MPYLSRYHLAHTVLVIITHRSIAKMYILSCLRFAKLKTKYFHHNISYAMSCSSKYRQTLIVMHYWNSFVFFLLILKLFLYWPSSTSVTVCWSHSTYQFWLLFAIHKKLWLIVYLTSLWRRLYEHNSSNSSYCEP